jgi:hypothetical protein
MDPYWETHMTLQGMHGNYDPDELTRTLARIFARDPPTGVIVGRTALRNAVMDVLGCSELEGEEIVDTLVLRGRLVFVKEPCAIGVWAFLPAAN